MRSTRSLRTCCLATVLVAALSACAGSRMPAGAESSAEARSPIERVVRAAAPLAEKPNIVLITADDMRPGDLKAMPFTRTVLATRGVRFDDALSPFTLCCPARAEIITGQYSHNNGVRGNKWPNGGYWALTDRDNTLPVWLRDAGYRTGFVGKYMNGYEGTTVPTCDGQDWCAHVEGRSPHEIPPGWNRWYASVRRTYNYWGVRMRVGINGAASYESSDRYQSYLYADIITDRIIPSFLAADRTTDRPFFVWFSSATPHGAPPSEELGRNPVPYSPDPSQPHAGPHWQQWADEPLPTSDYFRARFNEDTSDKAGPMTRRAPVDRDRMRSLHRHRLASLVSLDDAVEQIVTKLKATGEWDNTVIIFTSDNGFALGEHRLTGKDMPYNATLKVPMIVNAPGLKTRYDPDATAETMVRSGSTVTTLDIPATIVGLAGATPGRALEGINMMFPRANPDFGPDGDRAVLIESGSNAPTRSRVNKFVGVRTDRWVWFGWDARSVDGTLRYNALGRWPKWIEFYDLVDDGPQVHNIHGLAHPQAEQRMRSMVQQRYDCAGSECVWEATP